MHALVYCGEAAVFVCITIELANWGGEIRRALPASSHPRSPPESVSNNRIRWNAPLDGIFKINFDITIPKEVSQAHCRESKGHVLVATMKLLESILEPREVEAYAF
ncbi:hypothetical protein GYH30_009613 [Glycine max]|nr:hypothetical protein GYH30_009613 [Glycine max]